MSGTPSIIHHGLAAAGTALLALAASCASPTASMRVVSAPSFQVQKNSSMAAERIKVIDRRTATVNGLLKVEIEAQNQSLMKLNLEYRFKWLNKQGFEVKSGLSAWSSLSAEPKDVFRMTAVAPHAEATDWELLIRFADRW